MDILEHMWVEILKWIPVKSLLRFRSVSKTWLFLIDGNDFIKVHLATSRSSNSRFFCEKWLQPQHKFSVNGLSVKSLLLGGFPDHIDAETLQIIGRDHSCVYMIGSCNGIVCYLLFSTRNNCCRCWLWNPSTRENKGLRDPNPFDRSNGVYSYGFGFDESSGDHKVVVIKATHTYLYSLRLDSWKRVASLNEDGLVWLASMYLKGKLYWLRSKDYRLYDLVSFDLATQAQRAIELPMDNYLLRETCWNVGVLGDRIYLGCKDWVVDIWLLNEDNCSWDKPFRIQIHSAGTEVSKKLCARVTNKAFVDVFGFNFLISLDGSTNSDNMMIIIQNTSINIIPLLKWEVSLAPLNRRMRTSTIRAISRG